MGKIQQEVTIMLTPQEQVIYEMLCAAAENDQVCPMNLDFEMVIGCGSGSTTPNIVKRLECKGLIRVVRYQRFRRVQIVATEKWTARHPSMHVDRLHVPRGSRRAVATDRKPYKRGL